MIFLPSQGQAEDPGVGCNGWVQHDLAVHDGVKWAHVVWESSGSDPVTMEDFPIMRLNVWSVLLSCDSSPSACWERLQHPLLTLISGLVEVFERF